MQGRKFKTVKRKVTITGCCSGRETRTQIKYYLLEKTLGRSSQRKSGK